MSLPMQGMSALVTTLEAARSGRHSRPEIGQGKDNTLWDLIKTKSDQYSVCPKLIPNLDLVDICTVRRRICGRDRVIVRPIVITIFQT